MRQYLASKETFTLKTKMTGSLTAALLLLVMAVGAQAASEGSTDNGTAAKDAAVLDHN